MAGIAEQLRQAVLQAAIQGKLTEQLPEDGNAEDLLSFIKKNSGITEESKCEIDTTAMNIVLPNNWVMVRVNELFKFVDYRGKTPHKTTQGVFLVTASNIRQGYMDYTRKEYISDSEYETRKSRGITEKGDILFTTEAPMGNAALCDLEVCSCGQRIITFKSYVEKSISPELYVLFFASPSFQKQLLDNCTGTTAKGIKAEKLKQLLLPLPPLEEQYRIAARVDELMAKIDELEKIENELNTLHKAFPGDIKTALLQAAMQGKLTEQLPGEKIDDIEKNLYIDNKLRQIEETPFDIPQNWKWIQVGNLGESADTDSFADGPFGSNLKREHQIATHEVRIIQLSNIGENGWRNENEKYTSFKHLETKIPRCEVTPGCIVIAKMMPAGRAIIVPELGTRITLGSDAMKFKPNSILNKRFLLYALRSQAFLSQVYANVHGITRVRTTLKGIKEYVLPIPPLAEQQRIVEKLDKLLPLCDSLEEKL